MLPQGFNYLLADSGKAMTVKDWERLGVPASAARRFRARPIAPIC